MKKPTIWLLNDEPDEARQSRHFFANGSDGARVLKIKTRINYFKRIRKKMAGDMIGYHLKYSF